MPTTAPVARTFDSGRRSVITTGAITMWPSRPCRPSRMMTVNTVPWRTRVATRELTAAEQLPDPLRRRVLLRRPLWRRSPPSDPLLLQVGRQGRGRRASKTPSPHWKVRRCDWPRSLSPSLSTRSSRSAASCPQASSPCGAGTCPPTPSLDPSLRAQHLSRVAPSSAVVTRWRPPRNARQEELHHSLRLALSPRAGGSAQAVRA